MANGRAAELAREAMIAEAMANAALNAQELRKGPAQKAVMPSADQPGVMGFVTKTVSDAKDERYDASEGAYRFNLYASVLIPKSRSDTKRDEFTTEIIRTKITSRAQTYAERQLDAEAQLDLLIWEKLKPFMADHVVKKRKRKSASVDDQSSLPAAHGHHQRNRRHHQRNRRPYDASRFRRIVPPAHHAASMHARGCGKQGPAQGRP
jgi:hypothetical protein